MKANEAPEKIWIDPANDLPKLSGHIDKNNVEYIRKDAFIEKACSWFADRYQANGSYLWADDIEDFEEYMRGE